MNQNRIDVNWSWIEFNYINLMLIRSWSEPNWISIELNYIGLKSNRLESTWIDLNCFCFHLYWHAFIWFRTELSAIEIECSSTDLIWIWLNVWIDISFKCCLGSAPEEFSSCNCCLGSAPEEYDMNSIQQFMLSGPTCTGLVLFIVSVIFQ